MSNNLYQIVPFNSGACSGSYTPDVNTYMMAQGPAAASRAGVAIAINAPFENYELRETDGFQSLNKANPQLNIAASLQALGISINSQIVSDKDGTTLALLTNDGRAYTAQNLSPVEQEALRELGDDMTRRQRAAFYAEAHGLTDHGMELPPITQEHRELLRGKCTNANANATPRLSRDYDLELMNSGSSIFVINAPKSELNPDNWSSESNGGVIFPASPKLVELLNSGAVTDFTTRVLPSPDGDGTKLVTVMSCTHQGETFTVRQTRTKAEYLSGASLVIPFGPMGALVFTSQDVEISPCRYSYPVCFKDNHWNCSVIQGGVSYVSVRANGEDLGILKLPAMKTGKAAREVVIGLDPGETSVVTYLKVDNDPPRPVSMDALEDVFPLIQASAYDRKLICENQWIPLSYNGMARSKAQKFTDGTDKAVPPLPFVYVRPTINQSNGYQLENTPEDRVFSGFKSELVVRSKDDKEKLEAYHGVNACFLLLAVHDALKYSSNIILRVAYPNNGAYRKKFEQNILRSMKLVGDVLADAKGRPFVFKKIEWRTEAYCCTVCVEVAGINDIIGSAYVRYICSDMGGSTTDAAIRVNKEGLRVILPAIPIAGRTVTLGSMAQLARFLNDDGHCGLHLALRGANHDMLTVLEKQIVNVVRQELSKSGNTVDCLMGLADNQALMEGIQTIIDYFPLELDDDAGVLLKSLICMKDLLIQDILLRQSSAIFDPNDHQSTIHLLRLGNGSKCVDLIRSGDNHYCDSRTVMSQVLQERMNHHMEGVAFRTTFNNTPKTEVALGLTRLDEQEDFTMQELEDEGVQTLAELKNGFLEEAVDLLMDQVRFLRTNVPRICGDIDPYLTGLQRGFSQLLETLETREDCTSALLNTLRNEKGRFGSIYNVSARMAVGVWTAYGIIDAVDRQLAIIQAAMMPR